MQICFCNASQVKTLLTHDYTVAPALLYVVRLLLHHIINLQSSVTYTSIHIHVGHAHIYWEQPNILSCH